MKGEMLQEVWLGEIAAGIKLHDVWKVWNMVDSQWLAFFWKKDEARS